MSNSIHLKCLSGAIIISQYYLVCNFSLTFDWVSVHLSVFHRKLRSARLFKKYATISGLQLLKMYVALLIQAMVFIFVSSLSAGQLCITFFLRDFYIRLTGLKNDLLIQEVSQLAQWYSILFVSIKSHDLFFFQVKSPYKFVSNQHISFHSSMF